MGIYSSRAFRTYKISKEQYDFLLVRYGICCEQNGFRRSEGWPLVRERGNEYYFFGTPEDYKEAIEICEALNW